MAPSIEKLAYFFIGIVLQADGFRQKYSMALVFSSFGVEVDNGRVSIFRSVSLPVTAWRIIILNY